MARRVQCTRYPGSRSDPRPVRHQCYSSATLGPVMPTTRPRYTLTDVGELAEMLDVAQRRWPGEPRRQDLLVRLAALGRSVVERELAETDRTVRQARQSEALHRLPALVDAEVLLSDTAWR